MPVVRIGVFDSGVGGLSVLRELQAQLPNAELHYVADSGHAPYGERSDDYVVTRSQRVARHLLDHGAHAIVIACNTATAAAVQLLRETWPRTPIIGVEPGIKPALLETRNGRIGVMATRGTLNSEKFRRLAYTVASGIHLHLRACDGLAAAIERGQPDDPRVLALVEQHCAPLRAAGVDTVVLGCTHYAFVRHHIQATFGTDTHIIDTAAAVARQASNIVAGIRSSAEPALDCTPPIVLETTADEASLQCIARAWLGNAVAVRRINI